MIKFLQVDNKDKVKLLFESEDGNKELITFDQNIPIDATLTNCDGYCCDIKYGNKTAYGVTRMYVINLGRTVWLNLQKI